jgi:hypothetical protein
MSSLLSSVANHIPTVGSKSASAPTTSNPLDNLPTPPTLSPELRLLVGLACTSASTSNPILPHVPPITREWWIRVGKEWAKSVIKMIKMDQAGLPSVVGAEQVYAAAKDHFKDMSDKEREIEYTSVIETLVIASIFTPPTDSEKVASVETSASSSTGNEKRGEKQAVPTLSYTPSARQLIHTTLDLLSIPIPSHLAPVEQKLSRSLFKTLQQVSERQNQEEVARSRERQAEGWGGKTGRWLATGAGVVVGGVALGITGGLAAPAIAALIPGFMTFGLLTTATAPVVLGSIFGVTAGGLTGKRVRERWRGVDEFEFVDVKIGSKKIDEIAPVSPNPAEGDSASRETETEPEEDVDEETLIESIKKKYAALPDAFRMNKQPDASNALVGSPAQTGSIPARTSIESSRDIEDRTSRISLDDPAEREKRAEDEARLLEGQAPSLIVSKATSYTKRKRV